MTSGTKDAAPDIVSTASTGGFLVWYEWPKFTQLSIL